MLELSRARFKSDKDELYADISQWAGSISFVASHVLNVFLFGKFDDGSNKSCDAVSALSPHLHSLLSAWLSKNSDKDSRDSIGSNGSEGGGVMTASSTDSVMKTLVQVFITANSSLIFLS